MKKENIAFEKLISNLKDEEFEVLILAVNKSENLRVVQGIEAKNKFAKEHLIPIRLQVHDYPLEERITKFVYWKPASPIADHLKMDKQVRSFESHTTKKVIEYLQKTNKEHAYWFSEQIEWGRQTRERQLTIKGFSILIHDIKKTQKIGVGFVVPKSKRRGPLMRLWESEQAKDKKR